MTDEQLTKGQSSYKAQCLLLSHSIPLQILQLPTGNCLDGIWWQSVMVIRCPPQPWQTQARGRPVACCPQMVFFSDMRFISILGVIIKQLLRSTNEEISDEVAYGSVKLRTNMRATQPNLLTWCLLEEGGLEPWLPCGATENELYHYRGIFCINSPAGGKPGGSICPHWTISHVLLTSLLPMLVRSQMSSTVF